MLWQTIPDDRVSFAGLRNQYNRSMFARMSIAWRCWTSTYPSSAHRQT